MTVWRLERGRALRTAATALAVCLGYYVGANLGFILRFPPSAPSIMWPPNAILTVTLLLTPPRRWWIYLLAAFPAHLAAELGAFPLPLVLAYFVTNCSEALIAAVGLRLLSDAPTRFDTLRRMTVFLVAVVGYAPFLSSFLDAAAVTLLRGDPYWVVFRTRWLSNLLTELTLVPTLVMAIQTGPAMLRAASRARRIEAALLSVGLVIVGYWAFIRPMQHPHVVPGAPITPLTFVFPFILLSAVRFGPGGASAAMLATTLLAVFGATHDAGPFTSLPLTESVVALQILLTVVAIPVFCLAALIDERRRAQAVLAERLRFEERLSRLSRAFVHLPVSAMDDAFGIWLADLGDFLRLDRIVLLRLSEGRLSPAYTWTSAHVTPPARVVASEDFPWVSARLLRDEPVVLSRLEDLPAEAARDLATLRELRVRSVLTIPLVAGSTVLGGVALVKITDEREWSDDLVQGARLIAEVFASALARRDAEEAGHASELMRISILASLSNGVAVLDNEGRVISVNESWMQFARDGAPWNAGVVPGVSYLNICSRAARAGAAHAYDVLEGIIGVLDRSRHRFAFEHCAGPAGAERWFAVSVGPLNRPEGGAIVSQTDITEQKRAEIDARRSRDELAHFTRVSAMGELTASLAHELNQPLTGILSNAEAARRFLVTLPPNLAELNGALADIIDDCKRAGEVIHRVRDFLRKAALEHGPIDLNLLIQDMARLVSSDAIIRNVQIALDLAPDLPRVRGDRVQIQQVVLNLLLNAMEAMGGESASGHPILIRTQRSGTRTVRVAVEDAGGGLGADSGDALFEPFYTTKPGGMGMGLAIASSIIEKHGGQIWATNNVTRGATFFFTLPTVVDRA